MTAAVLTRRAFVAGSVAGFTTAEWPARHTFWVFGLLRPTKINLYPHANARLHVRTAGGTRVLEGQIAMTIDVDRTPIHVAGPHGSDVSFVLEIPGVIRRRYFGVLTVTSSGRLLRPVVTMGREVAVGSIVGAEMPTQGTQLHALAAQAVAARSFLIGAAKQARHGDAQFCDTTHCQFLRAPAAAGSSVAKAVRMTSGLAISAEAMIVPAHYSAACGGHTDDGELDGYRYRRVVCETCQLGGVKRRGHGLGLCQTGAMGLAKEGWEFGRIVAKYYAGCVIRSG